MINAYLATIYMVGYDWIPRGFEPCSGQLLSISQNQALYSLIGNIYGGDGIVTMGVPNLGGRVPVGRGQGPGLSSYEIGDSGGLPKVMLQTNQLPAHDHDVKLFSAVGIPDTDTPDNSSLAINSSGRLVYTDEVEKDTLVDFKQGTLSEENRGQSIPHENRQPYLTVNFVISVDGIYPHRS